MSRPRARGSVKGRLAGRLPDRQRRPNRRPGIEAVKARSDPTAHAEIEALRSACEILRTLDLSGCVLYTNVEPCWMCSYALRQTRIARVVFGFRNEKVGGLSSKFRVLVDDALKSPLPEIEAEILHEECRLLLVEYRRRNQRQK
jgi:tRNA(adenine34) deaminase